MEAARLAAPLSRTHVHVHVRMHARAHRHTYTGTRWLPQPFPASSRVLPGGATSLGHRSLGNPVLSCLYSITQPSALPSLPFPPAVSGVLSLRQDPLRAGTSVVSVSCVSSRASGRRDGAVRGPCFPAKSSEPSYLDRDANWRSPCICCLLT